MSGTGDDTLTRVTRIKETARTRGNKHDTVTGHDNRCTNNNVINNRRNNNIVEERDLGRYEQASAEKIRT